MAYYAINTRKNKTEVYAALKEIGKKLAYSNVPLSVFKTSFDKYVNGELKYEDLSTLYPYVEDLPILVDMPKSKATEYLNVIINGYKCVVLGSKVKANTCISKTKIGRDLFIYGYSIDDFFTNLLPSPGRQIQFNYNDFCRMYARIPRFLFPNQNTIKAIINSNELQTLIRTDYNDMQSKASKYDNFFKLGQLLSDNGEKYFNEFIVDLSPILILNGDTSLAEFEKKYPFINDYFDTAVIKKISQPQDLIRLITAGYFSQHANFKKTSTLQ